MVKKHYSVELLLRACKFSFKSASCFETCIMDSILDIFLFIIFLSKGFISGCFSINLLIMVCAKGKQQSFVISLFFVLNFEGACTSLIVVIVFLLISHTSSKSVKCSGWYGFLANEEILFLGLKSSGLLYFLGNAKVFLNLFSLKVRNLFEKVRAIRFLLFLV